MRETWTSVDRYFADLLLEPDPALDGALADSAAAGLPPISVSAMQGKLLMLLARSMRAERILEIGTLGGYSTIWLARALADSGRLVTLELESAHAEVALANVARAGLADRVELRLGRAVDSLSALVEEGGRPFDFIFIDADKPSYVEYLRLSLALSRPGTLIVADNVVRNGAVISAGSDDPMVVGVRRFNDALAADPRVSATVVQSVGSKGYDGLALAVVTEEPA